MALEKHCITVKPSKSHLNMKRIKILGNIIDKTGRRPDPSAIKAIVELDRPRNKQQLQSFLGLVGVCRDFVPALSSILIPLYALSKDGVDIQAEWDDNIHGRSLEAVKIIMTSDPVLKLPDSNKENYVDVDACRKGLGFGAIRYQKHDGQLHPVAYWSRSLSDSERRYSATNLECTALHAALMHWYVYLMNFKPFHVYTDHYALVYMVTRPKGDPHGRLSHMCIDLQVFGSYFNLYHREGNQHIPGDAISRLLRRDTVINVPDRDGLREDIGSLSNDERKWIENEFQTDSTLLIDIINEFSARQDSIVMQNFISMHSIHYSSLEPVFDLSLIGKLSGMIENFKTVWASPEERILGFTFLIDQIGISNIYEQLGLPNLMLFKHIFNQPVNRSWHHSLYTLLNRNIVSCKKHWLSDSLFQFFGNHNLALPNIMSDMWKSEFENYRLSLAPMADPTSLEWLFKLTPETQTAFWSYMCAINAEVQVPDRKIINLLSLLVNKFNTIIDNVKIQVSNPVILQFAHRQVKVPTINMINLPSQIFCTSKPSKLHLFQNYAVVKECTLRKSLRLIDNKLKAQYAEHLADKAARAVQKKKVSKAIRHKKAAQADVQAGVLPIPMGSWTELRSEITSSVKSKSKLKSNNYLETKCRKYDYLIRKVYEVNNKLYQILSITYLGKSKGFISIAIEQFYLDNLQPLLKDNIDYRQLDGDHGTLALVQMFEENKFAQCGPWPETVEEWVIAQDADKELVDIKRTISDSSDKRLIPKPHNPSDFLFVDDDKVLKRSHVATKTLLNNSTTLTSSTILLQIVIPNNLTNTCLSIHHDYNAHPGRNRTNKAIKTRYFWATMIADIQSYILNCQHCNTRKADTQRATIPILSHNQIEVFHNVIRWHIDATGPFPLTSKGNVHIILIKEALSKYVLGSCVPDKNAETIARVLKY